MNDRFLLILVSLLILLVADLGLYSIADAALVAVVISLFFSQLAVYILILLGTLQDTPGLAGAWWYVGFVSVGMIVIVRSLVAAGPIHRQHWSAERILMLSGVGLALYGLLISSLSQPWLGLSQSIERPYLMVGGLIIFNIVCAYFSVRLLNRQKIAVIQLRLLLMVILVHTVFVVMVQAFINPSFLSSAVSAFDFEGSGQLTTITSLGFARITGTYATPNGFALVMMFLLMFWLSTYGRLRVPKVFIVLFVVLGVSVSLLALSKAMLAFSLFCAAAIIFCAGLTGIASRTITLILAVSSMLLFSDVVFNDAVLEAFRFSAIDWEVDTYRNIAWRAVLTRFEPDHWIVGTGLSHWPVFFESSVGFRLADPHTWVFSYAGTFGGLGILFFAYTLWRLIARYFVQSNSKKALTVCLVGLLLVKDAVSIPYLLGNTPLTWFIWVLIFHVCSVRAVSKRERTSEKNIARQRRGVVHI